MVTVIEKIAKINEDLDLDMVGKAINIIGGDNVVCMQHLKLMLSLQPDEVSLIAYLIHEYVIEENIPIKKIEKTFGREVAEMIVAINHVFTLKVNKNTQPEILRKMFLTLAKDFRVVTVLLVKKLSELEHGLKDENPDLVELCHTAMDIYIPIATRLGIYSIKSFMEDICFEVLYPEDFKRIKDELVQYEEISDKYIGRATQALNGLLEDHGIKADISGRMKHPYSIYKKMQRKQKMSVSDIFDIFALRIVLEEEDSKDIESNLAQCYAVLGLIHGRWRPIARRFKDYIAVPKVNGYRSLHTTILGLTPDVRDEPTEVQIRTSSMHDEAEYGLASHWWYKESRTGHTAVKDEVNGSQTKRVKTQLEWLQGIADLHKEFEGDTEEGTPTSGLDLFSDQIFVLTPNGDVMDLPQGGTPIDFAYMIHTDVGNRCVQAKVNGNIVPLDSELSNGDVVQILTKKDAFPSHYWLSFVKTHSAKYRIKSWFREQDRENNLRLGRDSLNKELTKLNKPLLDPGLNMLKNYDGRDLSFKAREFILESIGNGHFSTKQVLKKLLPQDELLTEKNIKPVKIVKFKESDVSGKGSKVVISGEKDIPVVFASCCSPSFGMPIVGYVGRGQSVRIHDQKCEELSALGSERFIPVEWESNEGYYVILEIKTDDTPEMGGLIWERLKQFTPNQKELSTVAKVSDGVVRKLFLVVKDLDELQDIMLKLENLEGVYDIRKIS
ncbi:MAG: RelA/SpoT family protein [Candidatus Peregrinibacteria bacterium]|nr:RelA/SpoT family protein [Candidatus Peregrinibacteria bacterium]MDZ4245041.1 RelA/SpoT family protein [Candidatus Gracilibacteria bacterium]